jgi:hypothetical protein
MVVGSTAQIEEEALVATLRSGDADVFARLVNRHRPAVIRRRKAPAGGCSR